PLLFALSLHGFIVGQPFRLRPLRQAIRPCVQHKHKDQIWFTGAHDIAQHCFAMERHHSGQPRGGRLGQSRRRHADGELACPAAPY
ncbi:MAG: hypothetical protein J2P50_00005, partial [Hyphomicrobiaceae bacterium]|nr:hypothetical protein [Hyphomicrobiaceae bacterium]